MSGLYRNLLLSLVVVFLLGTLPSSAGTEGPAGPPGPPGAEGPRGVSGRDGPRGDPGLPGPAGLAGKGGLPGPAGPNGPTGLVGPPGRAGTPGMNGKNGHDGPEGKQGQPGPRGPPGPIGVKGSRGYNGHVGATGSTGGHGRSGATGFPGPAGMAGLLGQPGMPGPRGLIGPAGPKGPAGPRGPLGYPGPQGHLGPRGARGERGGPPGPPGRAGPPGPSGGPPGPPGLTGPPGPPGPPAVGRSRDQGTDSRETVVGGKTLTPQKPANIEIKKADMSEENKIMLYVALGTHILWLLLFIIMTATIIALYKKLKQLQQILERFTNVRISADGMLTKVGIYEQISNLSCDSSVTNMPGYQKLKQENRRSHSYAEMPASATPVNSLPLPARAGPSGKPTGASAVPTTTASTATTMVNNAVYRDSNEYSGSTTVSGSDYMTPVSASGGGTSGSLADADSVILGLRSTGIVVRDLRRAFESKELKRNRPIVQTNAADEDTTDSISRPQSMLTTTEDGSDYTGSQYLRVIPTPEGDADTLASDMYIDRESRTYVKSVKKKEEDP